ncbi:MAG: hypothetical protein ACK55I_40750, partial [bacterium]
MPQCERQQQISIAMTFYARSEHAQCLGAPPNVIERERVQINLPCRRIGASCSALKLPEGLRLFTLPHQRQRERLAQDR